MSMSQEEIESLMNGLDLAEDDASEVAAEGETIEIDTPNVAPAPQPAVEEPVKEELPAVEEAAAPVEEASSDDMVDELLASMENTDANENEASDESIDDIINNLESVTEEAPAAEQESVSTDDIDDLLASIESDNEESPVEALSDEEVDSSDIDELLNSLESVEEEKVAETMNQEAPAAVEAPVKSKSEQEIVESKINEGVFPLPAEPESKVVTQLSAVANDSEEKATKIFDVLSYILDENMKIESSVKKMEEFLEAQEKVLQTLTGKFPNVDVFSQNLEMLNSLKNEPKEIKNIINNENNELFSAMELMQYHDINRQKIERVMSVIRKLTIYLNNIFEDDQSHEEIVVAKHIAGDSTSDLVGDEDLDALIAEFGN